MAIGTSDGQVYEDELQYHQDQPLQITITKQKSLDVPEPSTYELLKSEERQMEYNLSVPRDENVDFSSQVQKTGSIQAEDQAGLQNYLQDTYHQRERPPVNLDPFNTKVQGKNQDRVPQSSGEIKFNPDTEEVSRPKGTRAQLQIDRADGVNLLSNLDQKVAAEGNSLTDLARNAYRQVLDTFQADHDAREARRQELSEYLQEDPNPNRRSQRTPLEDTASNTFGRELRRSPADGTFRTWDQYHNDWEGFNSVRIRRPRPEQMPAHGDRSGRMIYDAEGQRWVPARSSIGFQVQDEVERMNPQHDAHMDSLTDEAVRNARRYQQQPWTEEDEARGRSLADIETSHQWRERLTTGREAGAVEFETKTGKQGVLSYIYDKNKKDIYISWMGSKGLGEGIAPHELGIDKTMQILKAVVEQYPEAETVTALRAGGARITHGRTGLGAKVTRPIPRDRLEATPPAAPPSSTRMPGLPEAGIGGAMPGTRLTDLY